MTSLAQPQARAGDPLVAASISAPGTDWDKQLSGRDDASVFHGAAWAAVLSDTYGYSPSYVSARGQNGAAALLPLMEVRSWLTGCRGISLPFTDECEPLAPDPAAFQSLLDHAVASGKSRGWKYLELRGGRRFLPDALASQQFYTHEIDLVPDLEKLFASLKSPVRRAIRKAEKEGLTLRTARDLDAVRQFYSLQCQTRRKHGLPPQPFSFFENLHRRILAGGRGMVVLAFHGAAPVAANVFIHQGRQAIYKFGASDTAFQHLRGSDLVMWEGLKQCVQLGCSRLHLGRTSLANDGLRRFKLGWGAREGTLDYFKYDLRQKAFVAGRDEAFGWYNRVFALLPLSVSRVAGALLYRHVA